MNNEDVDHTEERARAFAERLRKIRERQGLKQFELAAKAGISAAAVSQLETGDRRPNFATLVSLAQALKVTPDGLLGVVSQSDQDPELRVLFRELEGMSRSDVDAVSGFISYLREKKKDE